MSEKNGILELHGKKYKIVTLDFETYYDKTYTLSGQLNTSEYIRDPRFHAHGVGIKIGNAKPKWYTGENIGLALRAIKWRECAMLAHNVAFDGFICTQQYGIIPGLYLDTLAMARGAHGHHMRHDLDTVSRAHGLAGKTKRAALADTKGKLELTPAETKALGGYCLEDVENTYTIFWKMVDHIPPDELRLIHITQRMFCEPVLRIDIPRVEAELANEVGGKIAALLQSGATPEDLMSNEKFAMLLKNAGAELPMKVSPSTGKMTYAFAKADLDFQALLTHENPKVAALARARVKIKSTIGETRANRFLEAGKDGMKLPVMLNYAGAHTLRWSGGNKMNLQNLKRGGELRKSILAPPGCSIVVADSAQIEARVLAWLAGQHDIVQAFATKSDVYKLMASAIFGIPIDQVTKDQRFLGKVCVAEGTLVLSDSGWKPIEKITVADRIWDGKEWVCHQGLLSNGTRPTLSLCGAWLTPDHLVWSGIEWLEAQSVVADENTLFQTLATGAESLPSQATYVEPGVESSLSLLHAVVTTKSTKSTQPISGISEAPGATCAPPKQHWQNGIGATAKRCPTTDIAQDCSTASQPQSPDATRLLTNSFSTTERGGFTSTKHGETIAQRFSRTFRRLKGGISRLWRWIAQTSTKGTSPETSGLSQKETTSKTNAGSLISRRVFDILNSGLRNRFTILTERGPVIVHNCVLGLGYGMGPVKLQLTLKQGVMGPAVDLTLEECQRIVNIYRSRNYRIRNLWKTMDGIIASMIAGSEGELGPLSYGKNFIRLPNDMFLQYYGLHGDLDENGNELIVRDATYLTRTGKTKIYGGLLTENVVQALARCIIAEQILRVEDAGWQVVTTTHDEIVAIAPTKQADRCLSDMLTIMAKEPLWAAGLPLAAEGGHDINYSK